MRKPSSGSGIHSLLQPRGGLFASVLRAKPRPGDLDLVTRIVQMGDLAQLGAGDTKGSYTPTGSGTALREDDAMLIALAEALERYCACTSSEDQFIRASASELGASALDLDSIPRCSASEYAHTLCPLVPPDKKKPIRWVRGLSLLDGTMKYVPAVMVYLRLGYTDPAERISLPITTGCAVHTTYERALQNAILEVIERDAISVLWLQRIPFPRIVVDRLPGPLADHWDVLRNSSRHIDYIFFDATTDLGVPTVYGLQIDRGDAEAKTLVSCATALEPTEALTKVIGDMASIRVAFRNSRQIPKNVDDFKDVFDGATYMARSEHLAGFDFLLNHKYERTIGEMSALAPKNTSALKCILEKLDKNDLTAFAVDLSTDEAIRCGLRAVKVVIPELQPLSFHYRARYLGHRRLFEAPLKMGYPVSAEGEVNDWPQPFA